MPSAPTERIVSMESEMDAAWAAKQNLRAKRPTARDFMPRKVAAGRRVGNLWLIGWMPDASKATL